MNNLIPICVNCKYFISEPTGIHRQNDVCGLTAIDLVTGKDLGKAPKSAFYYRGQNGLCGPGGKFFLPSDKPAPKKEKPKKEVKTVKVDVPSIKEQIDGWTDEAKEEASELAKKLSAEVANDMTKVQVIDLDGNNSELLPLEEGKKRRRRAK